MKRRTRKELIEIGARGKLLELMHRKEKEKAAKKVRKKPRSKPAPIPVTAEDVAHFWALFKPVVFEFQAKNGKPNLCPDWWRSRYCEHVILPKHTRHPNGFEYEQKGNRCWEQIWAEQKDLITQAEFFAKFKLQN